MAQVFTHINTGIWNRYMLKETFPTHRKGLKESSDAHHPGPKVAARATDQRAAAGKKVVILVKSSTFHDQRLKAIMTDQPSEEAGLKVWRAFQKLGTYRSNTATSVPIKKIFRYNKVLVSSGCHSTEYWCTPAKSKANVMPMAQRLSLIHI